MSRSETFHVSVAGPLVSIVTPSYNQAQFLEETILSVLGQDYPDIEYFVIDGGSTDGSVEIIKKYADRLAYWVSEPDRGQAHAINKGWRRAVGDVVAYLNSDDLYTPGAISIAVDALLYNPESDMVYSDAMFVDERGRPLGVRKTRPFDLRRVITTEAFMPQPTLFVRRHALDQIGLLDESLHMVMDYDLWIRLGLRSAATYLPGVCLAQMRQHATAKTTAAIERFPLERRRVLNKLYSGKSVPKTLEAVRGMACASVSFQQAILACRANRPELIWPHLLRAVIESPVYVAHRPFAAYLVARACMPWWRGGSSPRVWGALDRVVESLRA